MVEVVLRRIAIVTPAAIALLVLTIACITAAAVGRSNAHEEAGHGVLLSPLVGVVVAVVVVGFTLFLAS